MTVLHQVLQDLHAGRWHAAHDLVQKDDSMLGAWLHGILHLQEGDLEDAENWYNRAARHFRLRGSLQEEIALFEHLLAATTQKTRLKTHYPMPTTVTYLFDPLCGWCYGASPAIQRLGQEASIKLTLAPSGLFSGGGRVMSADFAEYAWSNDVRIQKLTGQPFSATYRNHVLGQHGSSFDSSAASLALTAVAHNTPEAESILLNAFLEARYVHGLDICTMLGAETVLRSRGFKAEADQLAGRDADLQLQHDARVEKARSLMQAHNARGVPTLIVQRYKEARLLKGDALYGDHKGLMAAIADAVA